jgi:hypothetical protein
MRSTSALTLAMISARVPLGANSAYQLVSSTNFTPSSLKVETSGSCTARARPDTASACMRPAVTLPI